ncbi:MAG: putative Co/Zn/Cd efflux system rane fusion protein [Myxococcaceae bacterium]|nr:putative Co/Zn/Cd efflux system rane fusion protein [Myxococcaceae bacterium]
MSERPSQQEAREPEPAPDQAAQPAFEEGEEAPPRGVVVMAIVRWGLVLAMAVAAAASLLHGFGERAGTQQAGANAQPYYCPMHPSVVQDQQGDCPICNMTLVLRPAQGAERASTTMDPAQKPAAAPVSGLPRGLSPLELSDERVQLIGMRTARVRRGAMPSALQAVAVVSANESAVSSVQTRFSGWIEQLQVAQTGQTVRQGQLLARIYSPELLTAQQELLHARAWQGASDAVTGSAPGTLLDNARTRLLLLGMAPSELAEVERTAKPHRLVELRAPTRGYVADKSAVLGLYVQPGTELFRIADLSRVWAVLEVFERDAGRVQLGQQATVTLAAYPGESFAGTITFIAPTLSPETRTLRARVELKNPAQKLKPGMFGNVSVAEAQDGSATTLLIPREALVDLGQQQYVFVAREAGHFEPRSVKVGARVGDDVQVLSGLSEGETVVTTGNFLLDSESRLRAAVAGQGAR